jgi:hypothetical protein
MMLIAKEKVEVFEEIDGLGFRSVLIVLVLHRRLILQ